MNRDRLLDSLREHEGLRLKAYKDSVGVWTIGYGRNLQELQIDQPLANHWLEEDMENALVEAKRFAEYHALDSDARRNAFVEMIFNLGRYRFMQFRKMLAAIREKDYNEASMQMLDSKWARQVGRRAEVLASQMRTGKFLDGRS